MIYKQCLIPTHPPHRGSVVFCRHHRGRCSLPRTSMGGVSGVSPDFEQLRPLKDKSGSQRRRILVGRLTVSESASLSRGHHNDCQLKQNDCLDGIGLITKMYTIVVHVVSSAIHIYIYIYICNREREKDIDMYVYIYIYTYIPGERCCYTIMFTHRLASRAISRGLLQAILGLQQGLRDSHRCVRGWRDTVGTLIERFVGPKKHVCRPQQYLMCMQKERVQFHEIRVFEQHGCNSIPPTPHYMRYVVG